MDHVAQVQRFIKAAGPALHSVTTIRIKVSQEEHWTESCEIPGKQIAAVLSPFANICTKVKKLKVIGSVGAPLLAAFGASCKHLTSLETVDVPSENMERLGELLPRVTSTRMVLFAPENLEKDRCEGADEEDQVKWFLPVISSCQTLTSLDTGHEFLSEDAWLALPSSLRKLHIVTHCETEDLEESGLPTGLQLPNLQEFHTYSQHMPLCLLAGVLRVAPLLRAVCVNAVETSCCVDMIPDLVLLSQRLSSSLVITPRGWGCGYLQRMKDRDNGKQVVLRITDLEADPSNSQMLQFASKLPVLECVWGLEVENVEQSLLAHFARAFPKLRTLRVDAVIESGNLPNLAVFTQLQAVDFAAHGNTFSASELEATCLLIPSLVFIDSTTLSGQDCGDMMAALLAQGRDVVVGEYCAMMKRITGSARAIP